MKFFLSILILILCFSCGTTTKKQQSAKAEFELSYNANQAGFVKAILISNPLADTTKVKALFDCNWNYLYSVDSMFVFLEGEELQKFLMAHEKDIKEHCNMPIY